jgi:hypothetical protein
MPALGRPHCEIADRRRRTRRAFVDTAQEAKWFSAVSETAKRPSHVVRKKGFEPFYPRFINSLMVV